MAVLLGSEVELGAAEELQLIHAEGREIPADRGDKAGFSINVVN